MTMATPNSSGTSETSLKEDFWNEETERIFREALLYLTRKVKKDVDRLKELRETGLEELYGINERDEIDELVDKILPTLARRFDGKALASLKKANPWLAMFEPGAIPDWEAAKSALIKDGRAFLGVLTLFTDLTHSDTLIGIMLLGDIEFSTRLLLDIRGELDLKNEEEARDVGTLNERVAKQSIKLSNEILDAGKAKGVTKGRIDALLSNIIKAGEDRRSAKKDDLGQLTYRCIFQLLWDARGYGQQDEKDIKKDFLSYFRWKNGILSDVKKWRGWVDYSEKIQAFVSRVGCAQVHDEPEDNIAELRRFHTTTIGYFPKLQEQYLAKELEVKKLRHHITALEFRYLLEHLPDATLDKEAGPRWEKFWKMALEDEANGHWDKTTLVPDHALSSLVNKRNRKRGAQDTREISTEGADAFLYDTGKTMYSILSDEIHRYPGEEYKVEDDDSWTEMVTDILRALKPLEANIDAVTHEVDWAAERKRYVSNDTGNTRQEGNQTSKLPEHIAISEVLSRHLKPRED